MEYIVKKDSGATTNGYELCDFDGCGSQCYAQSECITLIIDICYIDLS